MGVAHVACWQYACVSPGLHWLGAAINPEVSSGAQTAAKFNACNQFVAALEVLNLENIQQLQHTTAMLCSIFHNHLMRISLSLNQGMMEPSSARKSTVSGTASSFLMSTSHASTSDSDRNSLSSCTLGPVRDDGRPPATDASVHSLYRCINTM